MVEISYRCIYFPDGKTYGKDTGKPLKTEKGALKRAYQTMKTKKKGFVMVRQEAKYSDGSEISSPLATIRYRSNGITCEIHDHRRFGTYLLLSDGRLVR